MRARLAFAFAACVAGLLGALVGCSDPPAAFRVRGVSPDPARGPLRLNEPLSILFSADVDPSSVSADAVSVSAGGKALPGSLSAHGAKVTFRPLPVAAPDLADGSYPPGGVVDVGIRGFPSRTGLRAVDGQPLTQPYRQSFRVVAARAQPVPGDPFLDLAPGLGPALAGGPDFIDGWLRITFSEPLWPASVCAQAVQLRFDNLDRTLVECELRLLQGREHAEVWLRPLAGFAPVTPYLLHLGQRLLDVSGNEMTGETRRFFFGERMDALHVEGQDGHEPAPRDGADRGAR